MAAARGEDKRGRIRLSHQSVRDLRKWKQLSSQELDGRPMVPPTHSAALHTDAADVGYGGTFNDKDISMGADRSWRAQVIWSWKDRAQYISYQELKAIRMLLSGSLPQKVIKQQNQNMLLHVDNQTVVHITNFFVSASLPMMRELRKLKLVLDKIGARLRSEWKPSVTNKFADGLSRRFSRGDSQITRQLRCSVVAGMNAPREAFPYRPVGEHPRFLLRQRYSGLASVWDRETVRLLCPPVDLISATVHKLKTTAASAMLLIPNWPLHARCQDALRMASRVEELRAPPHTLWSGYRKLNPKWSLLLLEINRGD